MPQVMLLLGIFVLNVVNSPDVTQEVANGLAEEERAAARYTPGSLGVGQVGGVSIVWIEQRGRGKQGQDIENIPVVCLVIYRDAGGVHTQRFDPDGFLGEINGRAVIIPRDRRAVYAVQPDYSIREIPLEPEEVMHIFAFMADHHPAADRDQAPVWQKVLPHLHHIEGLLGINHKEGERIAEANAVLWNMFGEAALATRARVRERARLADAASIRTPELLAAGVQYDERVGTVVAIWIGENPRVDGILLRSLDGAWTQRVQFEPGWRREQDERAEEGQRFFHNVVSVRLREAAPEDLEAVLLRGDETVGNSLPVLKRSRQPERERVP